MATATPTVQAVSLTHARIDGKLATWRGLIRAARQDRESTETDHRNCPLGANDETELADQYRAILTSALPLLRRSEHDAYLDYCGNAVTTRGSDAANAIGHGSWVSGPDGAKQSTHRCWRELVESVARAAAK